MSKLDNYSKEKLENIALIIKRWKSPIYWNSTTQIIKSGQARWVKQFDFSTKYYVDEKFILDERKLEKWDILINSTGIGTAGRVTLFNLDGNFVVDSHITILRLDNEKALSDFVLQSLVKIWFKTLEAMANWQSWQIELNISTIQNITIPLPPLQIQQQIVSEIEKIEKEIDVLEQELSKIPEIKNEILKKYL
jgi:restriction endonuclease S subunit